MGDPTAEGGASRAACALCGKPTYDPDKRSRPWSRGVSRGRQVLVCPECQASRPDWASMLDACESCGSTRLSSMLGEVTCRACGTLQGERGTDDALGAGSASVTGIDELGRLAQR